MNALSGWSRKRWLFIGVLAAGVITAAVVAAIVWWPRPGDSAINRPDIGRLPVIVESFPHGFTIGVGQKVLALDDVAELKKPSGGIVSPPECAATPPDRADNVLGAKMVNVDAGKDGVYYMVSAQEALPTSTPHTDSPIDCSTTTVQYNNGYAITTPAHAPVVDDLKVEALRTVSRIDGKVQDSYVFRTWIDSRRVITVAVYSDPNHQPPANPIDPTLAQQVFADAVHAVSGEQPTTAR
ncbi:hypothetical protein BN970_05598 [Mycolicibacterium conceptionense]|uniref:DUF5642 domain-containing protein n=2 Tax=Mycolicibacterium conceptionense TaxID=451644 RepID=A0A0U1DUG9_9MYCO|nr:DUF5642 family protein [Mycolicibacterium conceptionense]CQD23130.1 hypothetical protein BN970_05598 [Mycolicibacterium conceptionense]